MSSNFITIKIEPIVEPEFSESNGALNPTSLWGETTVQPEFVGIKQELEESKTASEHRDSETLEPFHPSVFVKSELGEQSPEEVKQVSDDGDCLQDVEDTKNPVSSPKTDIGPTVEQPGFSGHHIKNEDISQMVPDSTGKFLCPLCRTHFANKSNLRRHLLRHPDVHGTAKLYECKECNRTFKTSSNLSQHKKTHLAVKPYSCEICFQAFNNKYKVIKHQGKSRCKRPVIIPLVCHFCDKEFFQESLLKSHLRMHTTDKQFECDTCGVQFKYKSTIIRHMQRHSDTKYSCKVCGKTFTQYGSMESHMRKHTEERPYACPICQKRFTHKHNLKRHTFSHNRVKHLVCEVCHKEFPRESNLKYHMRRHMDNNRPFKCDYCPKAYTHKQNIIRHHNKEHPNEVFDKPETDASVARAMWQTVMNKKTENEYVLPERELPGDAAHMEVKVEITHN